VLPQRIADTWLCVQFVLHYRSRGTVEPSFVESLRSVSRHDLCARLIDACKQRASDERRLARTRETKLLRLLQDYLLDIGDIARRDICARIRVRFHGKVSFNRVENIRHGCAFPRECRITLINNLA
jgi:hypothetical protein